MKLIPAGAASVNPLLYEIIDGANVLPVNVGSAPTQSGAIFSASGVPVLASGVEVLPTMFGSGAPTYGNLGNGLVGQRVPGGAGAVARGSTVGTFPFARRPNSAPIIPSDLSQFYRYRWDFGMIRTGTALGAFGAQLSRGTTLNFPNGGGTQEVIAVFHDAAINANWHFGYRQTSGGAITTTDLLTPATNPISVAIDYTDGPVPVLIVTVDGTAVYNASGDANMPAPQSTDMAMAMAFGSNAAQATSIDFTFNNRYRIWRIK
jgi:hypothetical protein